MRRTVADRGTAVDVAEHAAPVIVLTMSNAVRTWAEMIKLTHSVFALPFALVAMVLAARRRGVPLGVAEVTLILICMVAARSYAMTFNRLMDHEIDRRNPRTAGRPLPTGRLTRTSAWTFLLVCAATFVAGCAGFWWIDGNAWPTLLSGPVLIYLAAYSLAKRHTSLSHFVLGAAIASAPVAAWLAIDPAGVGWSAILLLGAAGTWIAGFDIIYACQDIEVDRRDGLHSIPARLGAAGALRVSRACHVGTIAALVGLARFEQVGWLYWAGVICVAVLLIVEQAMVRADDLSRVNMAFFTVNGVVGVLFGAATIGDVWMRRGP